ncbi:MAG TPA: tyrosine-type recombinase/integrase [Povalibacter sp.]|uniref:tyrosine-type recombinase/integrase n=1 Tax=Povalibacter sp. TaxID=1962978 RepID=UPI002C15EF15|nr:tyrosine-type recombinase/integrase [Povalibacter sp.]HMN44645.1 tyrosine-type recombinase/integrase [Povalibacter sp.]
MATIRPRRKSDGTLRYTAQIRLRKGKLVVHSEAKTFMHRAAAEKWAKAREVALESPGELARSQFGEATLKSLIRWYIDDFRELSKWQRTKQSQLEFLEKHSLGAKNALALTAATLVDHIRLRRMRGAGPATASNDLTWIGVVLRAARSIKQLPVRPEVVDEARDACRELRLIGKSRRRDRRPTPDELAKLDAYFSRRDRRSDIPMRDILWFAIHSARRQAEICRLEVEDNDEKTRTGLVRNAKHPTSKEGNDRRFKYTPEAWEIVARQAKENALIFPYDSRSVGAAFTRACKVLGIKDLRFHDLRHEGTSRLFERGYQIHEVAQFTLHDSWNELKRYTNLRPEQTRDLPLANAEANGSAHELCNAANSPEFSSPAPSAGRSAPPNRPRSRAKVTSGRRVGKHGTEAA